MALTPRPIVQANIDPLAHAQIKGNVDDLFLVANRTREDLEALQSTVEGLQTVTATTAITTLPGTTIEPVAVSAADVSISDVSNYFESTNVEDALQDIGYSEQQELDTGIISWSGTGAYYSFTSTTFNLLRGGIGMVKGRKVVFSPASVACSTANTLYYICVDVSGTVSAITSVTEQTFIDNFCLFEVLYDGSFYSVVREDHPYSFNRASSRYLHNNVGAIIRNSQGGANITRITTGTGSVITDKQLKIVGADSLEDHGIETVIPDTAGAAITIKFYYTNASGKWVRYSLETHFPAYYNNAGVPALLTDGRRTCFRIYVSKDDLNSSTPTYYAVMDTAQYTTIVAARNAIASGITAATNELAGLELAQLGYAIVRYNSALVYIEEVEIQKSILRGNTTGSGSSNLAALVSVSTSLFDGMLSATDTSVQNALETVDEFSNGLTANYIPYAISEQRLGNTTYLANTYGIYTGANASASGIPLYLTTTASDCTIKTMLDYSNLAYTAQFLAKSDYTSTDIAVGVHGFSTAGYYFSTVYKAVTSFLWTTGGYSLVIGAASNIPMWLGINNTPMVKLNTSGGVMISNNINAFADSAVPLFVGASLATNNAPIVALDICSETTAASISNGFGVQMDMRAEFYYSGSYTKSLMWSVIGTWDSIGTVAATWKLKHYNTNDTLAISASSASTDRVKYYLYNADSISSGNIIKMVSSELVRAVLGTDYCAGGGSASYVPYFSSNNTLANSAYQANSYGLYMGANASTASIPLYVTIAGDCIIRSKSTDAGSFAEFEGINAAGEYVDMFVMGSSAADTVFGITAANYAGLITNALNGMLIGNVGNDPIILGIYNHEIGRFEEGGLTLKRKAGSNWLDLQTFSDTTTHGSVIVFEKSHVDTIGSLVATVNNDYLGVLDFYGVDSTSASARAASFRVLQNGALTGAGLIRADMEWLITDTAGSLQRHLYLGHTALIHYNYSTTEYSDIEATNNLSDTVNITIYGSAYSSKVFNITAANYAQLLTTATAGLFIGCTENAMIRFGTYNAEVCRINTYGLGFGVDPTSSIPLYMSKSTSYSALFYCSLNTGYTQLLVRNNDLAGAAITAWGSTATSTILGVNRAGTHGFYSESTTYAVFGATTNIPVILGTNNTENLRLIDGGIVLKTDIYSDAYQSFSPTVVGFSATTTAIYRYKKVGDLVFVHIFVVGTSNANNVTVTLPYANNSGSIMRVPVVTYDTTGYDSGIAEIASVGSTLTFWHGWSSVGFATTGAKHVYADFFYKT